MREGIQNQGTGLGFGLGVGEDRSDSSIASIIGEGTRHTSTNWKSSGPGGRGIPFHMLHRAEMKASDFPVLWLEFELQRRNVSTVIDVDSINLARVENPDEPNTVSLHTSAPSLTFTCAKNDKCTREEKAAGLGKPACHYHGPNPPWKLSPLVLAYPWRLALSTDFLHRSPFDLCPQRNPLGFIPATHRPFCVHISPERVGARGHRPLPSRAWL